jgi:hypothetical protein
MGVESHPSQQEVTEDGALISITRGDQRKSVRVGPLGGDQREKHKSRRDPQKENVEEG